MKSNNGNSNAEVMFSKICGFYNWSLKGLKFESDKLQDISI